MFGEQPNLRPEPMDGRIGFAAGGPGHHNFETWNPKWWRKIRREYSSEYFRAVRRGMVITKSVFATMAGPARNGAA